MKERPILFNTQMVQAVLAHVKTQTRRQIKSLDFKFAQNELYKGQSIPHYNCIKKGGGISPMHKSLEEWSQELKCPYGKAGDRLWVRETWSHTGTGVWSPKDVINAPDGHVVYKADEKPEHETFGWFPSIFMYRKYSRILLEVTKVRIERLQDITQSDAIAEGVPKRYWPGQVKCLPPTWCFMDLWQKINGNWDENPWVWVVEFKVLEVKS